MSYFHKNNTNEYIYKTETDSQIQKKTCGYRRGEGKGEGREKGKIRGMELTDTNYYI